MAAHSCTLAGRLPWTEEPGGPQSAGLQRVGHDWSYWTHTETSLKTCEAQGGFKDWFPVCPLFLLTFQGIEWMMENQKIELPRFSSVKIRILVKYQWHSAHCDLDFHALSVFPVNNLVLTLQHYHAKSCRAYMHKYPATIPLDKVFVQSNQGEEETTRISYFTFIGTPVQATNMHDFKRVVGKKGESH